MNYFEAKLANFLPKVPLLCDNCKKPITFGCERVDKHGTFCSTACSQYFQGL